MHWNQHMKTISVHFPKKWIALMDELCYVSGFPNRSEFVRHFVRKGLEETLKTEYYFREVIGQTTLNTILKEESKTRNKHLQENLKLLQDY